MFAILFQISRNTFRETLRAPIFMLVLLAALTIIGLTPLFSMFVFREQVKLVVDTAMATTLVFGWIVAVLSASHAIAWEIDSGTALLMLSKPVTRPVFVLGKILGILVALTLFWFITSVATLLAVRIAKDQFRLDNVVFALFFGSIVLSLALGGIRNFIRQSSFSMAAILAMLVIFPAIATISYFLPVSGDVERVAWNIMPALVLILYATWAMGTLATALSTRLDLASNLTCCFVIFLLGLMSDYLFGRHADSNLIAAALYSVIPNWQLFWMADALAAKQVIPLGYVLWGAAYIVLFISLFVVLAMSLFYGREVGNQTQG